MEDEFDEKAAVSMTKFLALLLAFLLIFAPAVIRENVKNAVPSEKASFSYEHDPRENPSAMRDIVVNPDAVYGFSPSGDEQSTLKDYVNAIDWTDPAQVASAREQRAAYHESLQELYDMILSMTKEDKDIETIARAVS
jgi:hypothetical protein